MKGKETGMKNNTPGYRFYKTWACENEAHEGERVHHAKCPDCGIILRATPFSGELVDLIDDHNLSHEPHLKAV